MMSVDFDNLDKEKLEIVTNTQKLILTILAEAFSNNEEDFVYLNLTLSLILGMKLKDFGFKKDSTIDRYLAEICHNAKTFMGSQDSFMILKKITTHQ
ncbi:MAG TPA: hypothetical protein VN703_08385 [Candidatus Sulfopaludibacter sp.]|nr:hypothetical protein [Candidatus Sulfopaludibacter sp.]